MPEAISLKFGMWSAEGGGNLHSKICLVSSRQHRATEVRKLRFLSSCQYTHGVARRLLGPHDTLPCVLIIMNYNFILLHCNALHTSLWYIIFYQLLTISEVSLYLFEKLLLGISFNTQWVSQ